MAQMNHQQRVGAVAALGFSNRQARFLVTVALHSGYCLRRQYEAFAGVRYGKNVRAFLDNLVTRGLAERFAGRADRGHLYHLHGRALYRAIGEGESRNRRAASPALIARKLMLLDTVIRRPDVAWFATERDKVALLVERLHVPLNVLPSRAAASSASGTSTRHFLYKLPIFLPVDSPTPHFVYLATDGSPDAFAAFLRDHSTLLPCVPTWAVVVVGPAEWPGLQVVFDRFAAALAAPARYDDLEWFFERRQLVDRGNLTQVSVWDLRRYRDLRQRFDSPVHDAMYADWLTTGRISTAPPASPTGDSHGTLVTDVLPFAYEQFGSLPGVA
jgi:hypothetical protein